MRALLVSLVCLVTLGCGGAPAPPPAAPSAPAGRPEAREQGAASAPREGFLPPAPAAVPTAPAECTAALGAPPKPEACGSTAAEALGALAAALAQPDSPAAANAGEATPSRASTRQLSTSQLSTSQGSTSQLATHQASGTQASASRGGTDRDGSNGTNSANRDRALAALEGCAFFEPGLVRALRADLGPAECGDVLVEPFLAERGEHLDQELREVLTGLALAARLHRLVRSAPTLAPPLTRERFDRFFKGELVAWIAGQAKAIGETATAGARLRGYGKVLVAVEAGMADMRFVEAARGVPLPADMAADSDVRNVYYAALDEALEPRKTRGRDAALVALGHYAALGVLGDRRVDAARALLSELYGGRRIDALDGLLLPALPPLAPKSTDAELAQHLPTFYMGYVGSGLDPSSAEVLRALLEQGLPAPVLARLTASPLSSESARLLARGFVRLGQRYWRSEDFQRAAELASSLGPAAPAIQPQQAAAPAASVEPSTREDARFLGALALALRGGPRNAAEMMLHGPTYPAGVGDVSALDALVLAKSPHAALAAYDAAYLLRLAPPTEPDAGFWKQLERRFRQAAKLLADPTARRLASDAADAARDTARAITEQAKQQPAPGAAKAGPEEPTAQRARAASKPGVAAHEAPSGKPGPGQAGPGQAGAGQAGAGQAGAGPAGSKPRPETREPASAWGAPPH